MEENILTCLENFDVLWQRVCPGGSPVPAPPAPPSANCFAALWGEARELACSYRRLAGQFQGTARALLLRHMEEAARQARRLKAEHFLRCGECPGFALAAHSQDGRLSQLRRLWLLEKELGQTLAQAAQTEDDPGVSECLSRFSRAAAQRAEENRRLLLRMF